MGQSKLRAILYPLIVDQHACTHAGMDEHCQTLGLPLPPPEIDAEGRSLTKRERLESVAKSLPDHDLPAVAQRLIDQGNLHAQERNKLQDILWERAHEISKRTRREIISALSDLGDFLDHLHDLESLLERFWVLDNAESYWLLDGYSGTSSQRSLRDNFNKHMCQNSDWDLADLFSEVGAIEASNGRFARFLEGLVSPSFCPDEVQQRAFVAAANGPLRKTGLELRESEWEDGYPVFRVVALNEAAAGKTKHLIFASSIKPDLRFLDAVTGKIEVVTHQERVLVYDRPINSQGLRWKDLQQWWSEVAQIDDPEVAKRTLYCRLRECLPSSSPPQLLLFECYYKTFGKAIPELPALLPEVWLHWDPKTVKQRGADALLRFRMDFLMLLPNGIRVVLEVDGEHHYKTTTDYASMAAADRELKLAGYHVFRFGAQELRGPGVEEIVAKFFCDLFARFDVAIPQVSG